MSKRKMFRKLLDLDVALKNFYDVYEARPLGVEEVELLDSLGRVLAEDIFSPINVPPFDKSIVDGYAVIAEDTYPAGETNPVKLEVIERVRTGYPPKKSVTKGTAIEVDTGAMVPRGATAVVPVEFTEEKDGFVEIYKRVAHGANIMYSGTDIGIGELVLSKGKPISFREIGVLSAIGLKKLKVYRKPKVAVFSIGDELIAPGEELEKAKIYDVNSYLLYSAVKENFGEPIFLGVAKDDADEVISFIKRGLKEADVVLSSGSTSAGTSDIVYKVIEEFPGPGIIAHGLKMAPGKPTVISVLEDKPYIGLPGNPSSALNVFQLIVAPLLWKLAGLKSTPRKSYLSGKSPYRLSGDVGRMVIQGVKVLKRGEEYHVYPIRSGSGAIRTLGDADGFVVIPPTRGFIEENENVRIHLLSEPPQVDVISIFAPPSPKLDKLVAGVLEKSEYEVKRLKSSSYMALRALKQGEADIAGVSTIDPETGESNVFLIKKLGLENEVEYVELFTREIVLVSRDEVLGDIYKYLIDSDLLVVDYPPNTDGYFHLRILLRKLAEERNLDVREVLNSIKNRIYVTKDYYSAISAVYNGRADIAVVPSELVENIDLKKTILHTETYGFTYYKAARERVRDFVESLKRIL